MRKLSTLFAVTTLAVGTFGLVGCEKEETVVPPATPSDTMSDSTGDTMATDDATTMPATTAPATTLPVVP